MDLHFDIKLAKGYKSPSQRARILTEAWAGKNLYCASCDRDRLDPAPDNTRVYDFVCPGCTESYQLKSRGAPLGRKVVDAAYEPMMESIRRNRAPNLFLLHYDRGRYCAENLLVVPRFFLSPSCIEARRPLSSKARRAGWVGCNILLSQLPDEGRIPVIKDKAVVSPSEVRAEYDRFRFLARETSESRGWTADILRVVEGLGKKDFTLADVYAFEDELKRLHPRNRNVRPKIRQQLQVLRDKGVLSFVERGRYRLKGHAF